MEVLAEPHEELLERTAELIQRAKTGDQTAMPELCELMNNVPSLCHGGGDVAGTALSSLSTSTISSSSPWSIPTSRGPEERRSG